MSWMRSISSFFRWIVVSVWVLVMIPVLVDFLKKWLEAKGGYKYAGEWIIDAVANVPRLPDFTRCCWYSVECWSASGSTRYCDGSTAAATLSW